MGFQWTIIASFLYLEIGLVIFLLLPFISPIRWQKLFKSGVLRSLSKQSNVYFNVFVVILVLFFVDAIRDVRRFTAEVEEIKHTTHSHFENNLQTYMKLFRAQRNYYISGFALFLWLVIRRLVTLISSQAVLMLNNESALKQAQSASDAAQKLLQEKERRETSAGETADNLGNIAKEEYEKEISQLRDQLSSSKEDLRHAKKDLESMKTQAESVSKEYDRLLNDYDQLRTEVERSVGVAHDKKDE